MRGIKPTILVLFVIVPFAANAELISIDFDELAADVEVSSQYSDSLGVIFQSSLTDSASPGKVVTTITSPTNSLEAGSYGEGIFLLFDNPIYSFSAAVFEYDPNESEGEEEEEYEEEEGEEEYYEEEYSVYIVAYDSGGFDLNLGDIFVHSVGFWSNLSISGSSGIDAIHIFGTQDFKIDEIAFETTRSVPEPSSLALFGIGLLGMAASRRRKKV